MGLAYVCVCKNKAFVFLTLVYEMCGGAQSPLTCTQTPDRLAHTMPIQSDCFGIAIYTVTTVLQYLFKFTLQARESKHRGSSKSSAKHPPPSYTQDLSAHEGVHERIQRRKSFTDANTESNLDIKGPRPFTSDPRLYSKNEDYVNLPPGSSKPRPKALSPVETPRSKKSPIPTPRSVSVDPSRRGGGGGGLAAPDPHQQSLSMPPMPVKGEEEEEDISHRLEDDIHSRALDVLETGSDKPTYALTSIPFDPFLECLYCNRKFRYGEIQKYRKHVNNCTGSSAV